MSVYLHCWQERGLSAAMQSLSYDHVASLHAVLLHRLSPRPRLPVDCASWARGRPCALLAQLTSLPRSRLPQLLHRCRGPLKLGTGSLLSMCCSG
jgi:hypothetical protein